MAQGGLQGQGGESDSPAIQQIYRKKPGPKPPVTTVSEEDKSISITSSIEHKRLLKGLHLVKCKFCAVDRVLPSKFKLRYEEGNWSTDFACYKLKFREVYCEDTKYVFKELAEFDQTELLENLLKKKKK